MSQQIMRLLGYLSIIILVVAGIGLLQLWLNPLNLPREQIDAMRSGDFQKAVSTTLAVENDPYKSADDKALAVYSTLGAGYRLSGDVSTRIADIQKMKKIILDPQVSLWIRVNMLNVLASAYSTSGGDQDVVAEVFKDAPFSAYTATAKDADQSARLSARKLFEWSYSMKPTSLAAISIARWHSEQVYYNPTQATSTTREQFMAAADYMRKADAASLVEKGEDPTFINSTRYLVYLHWRAVIYGRLAGVKGEPYQSNYRSVYDDFISYAQSQNTVFAEEYLHYARLYYARRLAQDQDFIGAKKQLDTLAQEMNAIRDPKISVFLQFLRTEGARPEAATWQNLVFSGFVISPEFKAAVEKVVPTK